MPRGHTFKFDLEKNKKRREQYAAKKAALEKRNTYKTVTLRVQQRSWDLLLAECKRLGIPPLHEMYAGILLDGKIEEWVEQRVEERLPIVAPPPA